jgi:hypothetical protein
MLLVSLAKCNLGCVSPNYAKRHLVVGNLVQILTCSGSAAAALMNPSPVNVAVRPSKKR